MEDNECNLGVMEDSSSRISSGQWSTEEADRGTGYGESGAGDSSLMVEAGASGDSQLDGDNSNSIAGPTEYLSTQSEAPAKDFEWSAARGSTENGVKGDGESEDEKHGRKRPFFASKDNDESSDGAEKRKKTDRHPSTDKNGDESCMSESRDDLTSDVFKADPADGDDPSEATWSAFNPIKPKLMKSEQLPDLEKFWRPVIESPKDFQAWTSLLQYVDNEKDVAAAREAYDSFLRRYPYCYGYWKKWADYEKKKAMKKDCEKVFERGLAAVPLSVDLWLHYLNYCRVHHAAQESFVREQFERAISVCGLEFRSDKLWELYINWEVERDDLRRVFEIYDKLLSIPTHFHTTHWDNFQDLVNQNDPKELLSPAEYEELKLEIFRERKISTEVIADIKLTEEEVQAIRKKTRERRQTIHAQTEKEIADRWAFEEGIKRPYFHVKPLERGQLKNWRSYLEFEIGRGHQMRIDILFERCLIACALYDEYWLMYAQHLEGRWNDPDEQENRSHIESLLRSVYRRACTIHVCDKPNLYLMWANFEEKTGDLQKANSILDLLEKVAPRFDGLAVRRVNLARRQGDYDRVVALYRKYIDGAKKDNSTMTPLSLRASRFAAKILGNETLAEEFIEKALEKDTRNSRLYLQLFDLRFHRRPMDVAAAVDVLNRALKSKMDLEQRCRFAHRKAEFLEDFGNNVMELVEAQDEYQKLVKRLQNDRQAKAAAQLAQQQASATNATPTETTPSSDESKTSKSEAAPTPTTTAATYSGAYDNSTYGYQAAGYGYPGWTGYGTGQYAGWGQGYYPQQYGQ